MKNIFKDKILLLALIFLALIVSALIWLNMELGRKTKQTEEKLLEQNRLSLPGGYQKGVPQKAEIPSAKAGEIVLNNSADAAIKLQFDTSIPYRKAVASLLAATLKEMGYALTIYNRDNLTDEFTIPTSSNPSGSHSSGCAKYGFRWDAQKGVIGVFYFVDQPALPCDQEKFMLPLLNAIGQAKGQIFEWWKDGLDAISKEQGRQPTAEDFPLGLAK